MVAATTGPEVRWILCSQAVMSTSELWGCHSPGSALGRMQGGGPVAMPKTKLAAGGGRPVSMNSAQGFDITQQVC